MQGVTKWLEERKTRKYQRHPAKQPAQHRPLPQHHDPLTRRPPAPSCRVSPQKPISSTTAGSSAAACRTTPIGGTTPRNDGGPSSTAETPLSGGRVRYLNGSRADAHVSAGVHRAFARQTPRGGTRAHPPAHLALRAVLDSIRFPHASPRSRTDYTRVWRALAATFPHLRKVRIRICPRFGEDEGFEKAGAKIAIGADSSGATRSDSRQFIDDDDLPEFQDAWLEGMEWAVGRLSDLALFQIVLHVDIYHHLRARVKLFLAARQRQQQQMWNAPDDRILSTRGDTRPLSADSSVKGLDLRSNIWVGGKGKWKRQAGGKVTFQTDPERT
ncbi:uncharacterized protein BO95DRAFT_463098 [Aspergillus brunneoviolaceus CBS 621.78]|uniref:Uncharacterized protein n=1 Tax=Aspergillus brunneoviolaceus CBS 621.78 TaxID=1450534 RepID=A0ACD1GAQ6_9EURO|nr:hypothetical protein BO95DRAFT_463098 [Aspergillus brunneoviolaceus CBS 621.78]RAH46329.1 hypothetical protein BO95DRAFT_463098 [Aspergillus brunneoviolaceus CBS 621.78]